MLSVLGVLGVNTEHRLLKLGPKRVKNWLKKKIFGDDWNNQTDVSRPGLGREVSNQFSHFSLLFRLFTMSIFSMMDLFWRRGAELWSLCAFMKSYTSLAKPTIKLIKYLLLEAYHVLKTSIKINLFNRNICLLLTYICIYTNIQGSVVGPTRVFQI